MQVTFQNVSLRVQEHEAHEWLLETALVAEGYGVTPDNIRKHKNNKPDELIEGKHFERVTNGYGVSELHWTKKGVVRLGFFIKSERAKQFRDWAEDLIVNKKPQTKEALWLDAMQSLSAEVETQRLQLDQAKHIIEKQAPKVELVDRAMETDSLVDIGQAAKLLSLPFGRNTLYNKLKEKGIFFKNKNEPKQLYVNNGCFELKERVITKPNGEEMVVLKVWVTQKGLLYLSRIFNTTKPVWVSNQVA